MREGIYLMGNVMWRNSGDDGGCDRRIERKSEMRSEIGNKRLMILV